MSFTPFIKTKDVAFAHDDRPILNNINFSIPQGNSAITMGSSDSDKTMPIRLITGQIRPRSGKVLIEGRDLVAFSVQELYEHHCHMGVLLQYGALFIDLSAFDNTVSPIRELAGLSEAVIRGLTLPKPNAIGLHGIENLIPSELFGGMSCRVAFARTTAFDPEITLYDEPLIGLDPTSLGVIAHSTSRTNKALCPTSVMVTYDIEKSLEIVDQVVFSIHGEIMSSGLPRGMRGLDSPWVCQSVGGLADNLVAYHYPAQTTLKQDLLD